MCAKWICILSSLFLLAGLVGNASAEVAAVKQVRATGEPNPASGATGMSLQPTLRWTAGAGSQSHTVYFGTTSPGTLRGNQTATTFNPGPLAAGTAYYWRVDEVNGPNTVTGTVWNFTTRVKPKMKLNRGIVIDRQFHKISPAADAPFTATDIKLIKSMGFEFVKVLVNPALFISGSTINTSNMWYLDDMVEKVLAEGMPVVVCFHPEPDFKKTHLGASDGFKDLLGFYKDIAAYMAARWDPNELALQLMTEPFANYQSWNTMQPQMWQAVRSKMPAHTLILSGDQAGIIEGLVNDVDPNVIHDNNVYYSFTTYYPWTFTVQGWDIGGSSYYPWLNNLPYPSSASNDPAKYILPECPNSLYSEAYKAVKTYCSTPWDMNQQRAVLKPIDDWNKAHGGKVKVWCAEWGCLDRVMGNTKGGGCNPANRIQFIHDRRQALEEINIGWAYWSYNDAFAVLNSKRVPYGKSPSSEWVDKEALNALGVSSRPE